MRLIILLLLFSANTLAAQLVPPSGFGKPLPHTRSGLCIALPAPYTERLIFRSKYDGSDSARATLNPVAEQTYRKQTKAITDFERGLSEMVWRYKQSGDPATLHCILHELNAWASAEALTSTQTNHTGRAMRKWALATVATGWIELKFMPLAPVKETSEIERWISLLADRVVEDWDGLPPEKTNNHTYWAAWSVMAASVAVNRRDLFTWSLKEYRHAVGHITDKGTLPNEMKRGSRALAYHHYALQPLVMIASFAQANHVDVMNENSGGLLRLAGFVLQHDKTTYEWLEPWCSLTDCDSVTTLARDRGRPWVNRRMGGNLTVLYTR